MPWGPDPGHGLLFSGGIGGVPDGVCGQQMAARSLFTNPLGPWAMVADFSALVKYFAVAPVAIAVAWVPGRNCHCKSSKA